MALYINGEGQNNFNLNSIDIERLFVNNELVWSKTGEAHTTYIAFNKDIPPQDINNNDIATPSGVTINSFLKEDTSSSAEQLLNKENNALSDIKIRFLNLWAGDSKALITGDESDALTDYQMVNSFTSTSNKTMEIYLPVGTHTIDISAASGQAETQKYIFDGVENQLVMEQPQKNKVSWEKIVTTEGWFLLEISAVSGEYARIGGATINSTTEVQEPVPTYGDYGMKISYYGADEMFAETELTGLTVDETYTVTLYVKEATTNAFRVRINTLANNNSSMVEEITYGLGDRVFTFTATSTTMYLAIGDDVASATIYSIVDNIEVLVGGSNAVVNGTFENGNTTGWYAQNDNAELTIHEYSSDVPIPPIGSAPDPIPTGTSYYFASETSGGSDVTGDGTKVKPFRTLDKVKDIIPSMSGGDAILFAMGDTFRYVNSNMETALTNINGTSSEPIIFSRYWRTGDEANTTLPILTSDQETVPVWTSQGADIWHTVGPFPNSRMLKDGDEMIQSEDEGEFNNNVEVDVYRATTTNILHRSTTSPTNTTWTTSDGGFYFYFSYTSYIVFNGLDMQWGKKWSENIELLNCHNITIQNCNIGKYSHRAITLRGNTTTRGSNLIIQNNVFDTGWRKDFSFAYITTSEGVLIDNLCTLGGVTDDFIIQNNNFIDFGHGAIIHYEATYASSGGKILYNNFSAPNSAYGRPMGMTGEHTNVEIAYNVFDQCSSQNQLGLVDIHIHHNVFSNWFLSNKTNALHDSIVTQVSSPIAEISTDCIIENNIFYELDMAGVKLAYNKSRVTVQNNIFYNCSKAIPNTGGGGIPITAYNSKGVGVSLIGYGSDSSEPTIRTTVKNNLFFNDLSSDSGNVCVTGTQDQSTYKIWKDYTVAELNAVIWQGITENNLEDDPDFVNTSEFRLEDTSPAIGTGIDPTAIEDWDGTTIVSPFNIGIYNTNA